MRNVAAAVMLAVGLLSVRTLESSQAWSTPAASWSDSQLEAFLNDSPWAGRALVQLVPRSYVYPKHKAVVTWESASLVRQARARSGHSPASTDPVDVPTYRVSVRIWGTARALELGVSPQASLTRTALRRVGKPDLAPIAVEDYRVNSKGQVVPPIPMQARIDGDGVVTHDACGHFRGRAPAPSPFGSFAGGSAPNGPRTDADRTGHTWVVRDDLPCDIALVLVFHFPATDSVAAGETVEFAANVGPQRITRPFQMSRMVVNGNLDLR